MKRKGILIVVSGFSGAGKGTLMKELLKRYDNYALSVSMTTRAPREGEVDGESYFFVDKETFERTIAEDGLIEYASYCGNYYGTPREYVEKCLQDGRDVILEIEIQGAAKVREKMPEAVSLFLVPPSFEELSRRLHSRGTDSEETIQQRLATARREVKEIVNYDYIVVNDTVDQAVGEILAILIAEGCRKERRLDLIEGVNGL